MRNHVPFMKLSFRENNSSTDGTDERRIAQTVFQRANGALGG
jgi:hypothetical protein